MNLAQIDVPVQAISWKDFRQEVEALYGPRFKHRSTRAAIVHVLNILEDMGVQSTSEFTIALVSRFIDRIPESYSKHTTKGYLLRLQAIVNHSARAGYLMRSPFTVRPIATWVRPGRPKGKRHLTREELARFRALMVKDVETTTGWRQWQARRLLALFDLISLTGLRRNEACYLRLEDVDLQARLIKLVDFQERELKTESSAAPVAMPTALVDSLRDWFTHRMDAPPAFKRAPSKYVFPNVQKGTPWTGGKRGFTPLDRLQAVAKRAGITEGVNWHALRRSLSTHLESHGVQGAMIARLLRHSEQVDEKWYRQADVDNMLRAVEGFRL